MPWERVPTPVGKGVPAEVTAAWQEAAVTNKLAKIEYDIAQMRLEAALLYQKRGELLRQAETTRRQGQHCEQCGHLFNYDTHGKLKKPADWCRPHKHVCKNSRNSTDNPDCLSRQEQERKAGQRASMSTAYATDDSD